MKPNKTPQGRAAFASSRRQTRKWMTAVACMAVLVAFGTIWALMMPAATLEGEAHCGLTEHTHNESCYESVLVCGQEEGSGHVHDDSCYETVLTCEIPEHTHTDECYAQTETGNENGTGAVKEDGTGTGSGTETGMGSENNGSNNGTGTGTEAGAGETGNAGTDAGTGSGNAGTGSAGNNGSAGTGEAGGQDGTSGTGNTGSGTGTEDKTETGSGTEEADGQDEDALTEDGKAEDAQNSQAAEKAADMPGGAEIPEGYTEQYTVRDDENGFAVTVYAPEGVVPEGAVLSAALLEENDDAYAKAEQELAEETEKALAENGIDLQSEDGETAEPSYGFAALDIHFEDADGNEVEPNGQVYVVIDAAGLIPEDADPKSVTVQHHAEQEDAQVAVETVADTTDSTDTGVVAVVENADQDKNDVQAAFEVSGFSTFTITWESQSGSSRNDFIINVTVYVDEQEYTGYVDDWTFGYNEYGVGAYFIEDKVPDIPGYSFDYANVTYRGAWGKTQTIEDVTSITVNRQDSTVTFQKANEENNTVTIENVHNGSTRTTFTAYLYYTSIEGYTQELSILDSITQDGMFTAVWTGGESPELDEGESLIYTWERSVNGQDYTEIYRIRVQGTNYNMPAENGTTEATQINVALDSLAAAAQDDQRYYYRVTAQVVQENGIADIERTYTAVQQVPYYIKLQNGSFENPSVPSDATNIQLPNGYPGLIWKTTGTGRPGTGTSGDSTNKDIEIVREGKATQELYGISFNADAGNQFAELNCELYGALYQDVMTVPGTTLNWSLAHAARTLNTSSYSGAQDTMALVIMPATEADSLINELENAGNDTDAIRNALDAAKEDGAYVEYITDPGRWRTYNGQYEIGDAQYLTRFFFVAVSASQGATLGNFLDDVRFTMDEIPVEDGYINLNIEKYVEGLSLDTLPEDYKITVSITGDENATVTFTKDDFVASGADRLHAQESKILNIGNKGNATFTVTESVSSTGLSGYEKTQTVSVGDEGTQAGTSADITIQSGEGGTVTFTNTYSAKEPLVPGHRKYIEDNQDGTYDLTLDVTGQIQTSESEPTELDILYVLDNSSSMDENISWGWASPSRLDAAKTAIKALENALKVDGLSVNHALAIFSSDKYGSLEHDNSYIAQSWTTAPLNLDNIGTTDYEYGTNYVDGIKLTKEALSSGIRPNAVQVVIFISDGEPNAPGNRNTPLNSAKNEIRDLQADRLYAVGVGGELSVDTLESLINAAENIPAGNKEAYSSSDSDELAEIFTSLAAELTSVDCSDVTITDTLSDYAKLKDDASFQIKIVNAEGKTVNVTPRIIEVDDASSSNGVDVSFYSGTDRILLNVKYDAASKTFTLDFPDAYVLENGWTYSITTQIEPTKTAYEEYRENLSETGNTGYDGIVGDPETDAEGNDTSSGQPGFHSNSVATLVYQSNGINTDETYPHPVIQVPENIFSLTIIKEFKGLEEAQINELLDEIQFVVTDSEGVPVAGSPFKLQSDGEGGYSVTVSDLELDTYSVTETGAELLNYSIETQIKVGEEDALPYDGQDDPNTQITLTPTVDTVTFINSYTHKTTDITVIKMDTELKNALQNAEFYLYKKEGSIKLYYPKESMTWVTEIDGAEKWISNEMGEFTIKELEDGTYYLEEVSAPDGYILPESDVEFRIINGKITYTSVNNKDSFNDTSMKIPNTAGEMLPETGGSGTTLLTIGGLLLMAGAVGGGYGLRRRRGKEGR